MASASAVIVGARTNVLRHRADLPLIGASLLHGALLVAIPSIPLVAVGLWWTANTVAHNFLHQPFFRSRALNATYSAYLSLLLGVPQSLWRERHLAHHADRRVRLRITAQLAVEVGLVAALWGLLVAMDSTLVTGVILPGWILGLVLCQLQGHYEHAHGTTSHYGRIYNALFFNDGYHVEHHARPGVHWSMIGAGRIAGAPVSRWPPVLRWLDALTLNGLERLVVRSPALQRFVVRAHERAFRRVAARFGDVRSITIVGGGLFPRTAIVCRSIWPQAALTIVDVNGSHLGVAQGWLDDGIAIRCERFDPQTAEPADLVVAPLAYIGERDELYHCRAARHIVVHDWIWRVRGRSVIVSPWLLKRLNIVSPDR